MFNLTFYNKIRYYMNHHYNYFQVFTGQYKYDKNEMNILEVLLIDKKYIK